MNYKANQDTNLLVCFCFNLWQSKSYVPIIIKKKYVDYETFYIICMQASFKLPSTPGQEFRQVLENSRYI